MNRHSTTKSTKDTKPDRWEGIHAGPPPLRDLRAFVVEASAVHGSNARVATRRC
ncbi:MAG: hypothetical protein AB7O66_09300 [Limisphaerales bacterium]